MLARRSENIGLTPRRRARTKPPALTEEEKVEIKEAFDLFDTARRGSIDYHELKVCLRALGFPVKKPEVLKLVRDADINNTGRIEYDDFVDIMKKKFAERDPDAEMMKVRLVLSVW